jgi:malate dehydrogenase (quinone)
MNQTHAADTDIILVGAGIMSATLAVFLKELDPSLRIEIFEMLEGAALESSDAWNNAGTGHAALCELNYTPQRSDGSIDISKALAVNVEFDLSRQFWSYLIRKKAIASPDLFIHAVPHMSLVHGAAHVAFLRKRYAALTAHHLYQGMEFTDEKKTAFGCAATTRPSTSGITPKSTAWPTSVRRRCPFRILIPGSSATPIRFCSGPMPASPPNS